MREEASWLLAAATTYMGPSSSPLHFGAAASGRGRGDGRHGEREGKEGEGSAGAAGPGPQPEGKASAGGGRRGQDLAPLPPAFASSAMDVLSRRGWGERGSTESGRWLRLLVLASQQMLLRQSASSMLIEMVSVTH